jgi:hypothetical protein
MPDAGNLAAFLLRLRGESSGAVYQRIVTTIRLLAPFFDDFNLEPAGPNGKDIILNWKEIGSDQVFGPHQLSDGTLRAMCLVTLLLQPEAELPDLIIVDEPELGLHPYALNVIAALFNKASHHTQVLISTQSSSFLDNFEPEDIVVVNREGKESRFIRPDSVDDGQHSAPSKRIVAVLPDYEGAKAAVGPQVAELIGLDAIRGKCPPTSPHGCHSSSNLEREPSDCHSILRKRLVRIAVQPPLAGLRRGHHGVPGGARVPAGVAVR